MGTEFDRGTQIPTKETALQSWLSFWTQTLLPTIPPTWTAPTSCFASTLYYRVFYNGNFFSNLYGTPTPVFDGNTPIGACIPPSFMINVPFRTDGGCPTGYTTACTSTGASRSGKQLTTVTCCPRYVCRCRFHADVDKIC